MLEQITASVKQALENDLPEIEDEVWGIVDNRAAMTGKIFRRPIEHDVEIYSFPQTWGSTGIGLSGAGGQMMTGYSDFRVESHSDPGMDLAAAHAASATMFPRRRTG